MTTNPSQALGSIPGKAFRNALENIRYQITSRGEIPQVRNLISDHAIDELNKVAMTHYDDTTRAVRFYGGMIHRYPQALFEVVDGESKSSRMTSRELADFMVVLVFTGPGLGGAHVHQRSRACLVQTKVSEAVQGPRVIQLDPECEDIPEATDDEQFFLLNQWPDFHLKNEVPNRSYGLRSLDKSDKPLGKYCFLWGSKNPLPASTWASSWQCGDAYPGHAANLPLGQLLADLIESHPHAGRDVRKTAVDDWDHLIKQLTAHCTVNEWSGESKLADPANVSFMRRVTSFGTLMQHAPYLRHIFWDRYLIPVGTGNFWSPSRRRPSNEFCGPDAMPVLIISVSSYDSDNRPGETSAEVTQQILGEAWDAFINR